MEDECFRCGVSSEKEVLFEAISNKGIVKICEDCAFKEDLPLVNKPTDSQLKDAEVRYHKRESIYNRLSGMAGIKNPNEHRQKFPNVVWSSRKTIPAAQETSLREIVDKKFSKTEIMEKPKHRNDLVDNFHWVLMRARRSKKLSQAQLAKEIGETETAIVMSEQGILPEEDYKFISKVENFFNIKIKKQGSAQATLQQSAQQSNFIQETSKPLPAFDRKSIENLKISDLQKMKNSESSQNLIQPSFSVRKQNRENSSMIGRSKDTQLFSRSVDDKELEFISHEDLNDEDEEFADEDFDEDEDK